MKTPTERVTERLQAVHIKRGRQEKRRARLERIREAFSAFDAGRISKTEFNKLVPRSWHWLRGANQTKRGGTQNGYCIHVQRQKQMGCCH